MCCGQGLPSDYSSLPNWAMHCRYSAETADSMYCRGGTGSGLVICRSQFGCEVLEAETPGLCRCRISLRKITLARRACGHARESASARQREELRVRRLNTESTVGAAGPSRLSARSCQAEFPRSTDRSNGKSKGWAALAKATSTSVASGSQPPCVFRPPSCDAATVLF